MNSTSKQARNKARRFQRLMEEWYDDIYRPPIHGQYYNGTHSRLSPDTNELIVAASERVLPLLLVTYEPVAPVDMSVSKIVYLPFARHRTSTASCWWTAGSGTSNRAVAHEGEALVLLLLLC